MDSIKYTSGGKFGRGVGWGKKGLWQRERARAESIFLLFFWWMRLGQRPSSRSRAANTNLQPQWHGSPGPIFSTTERGISWGSVKGLLCRMNKAPLQWKALPYQSSQKESWHNLSWLNRMGHTWLLCIDVSCHLSAANGLGCLQICFLFCTGEELNYLMPFLLKIFSHSAKFPSLKKHKAVPRYLANQSTVSKCSVPGRHWTNLHSRK